MRCTPVTALAAAPIASVATFGALPVIYYELGIRCDILSVGLVPIAAFAAAFLVSRRKADATRQAPEVDTRADWIACGLYAACGILACTLVFVANLGAPDAFFSNYDNQTHLNLIRSFLDSGNWSSLHPSRYLASSLMQIPYFPQQGFYPAAWHDMAALVCLVTGASITVASNALAATCGAIVFPVGMFLLMRALFPENRLAVLAGAIVCVSFATYPWVFHIKGPTFPNMLGYAIMVPALALTVRFLEKPRSRNETIRFVGFALAALVGLTLAHPLSLFTAIVFLAAFGGHLLNNALRERNEPAGKRAVAMLAYLLAIAFVWVFCLVFPPFQTVVGYSHHEGYPLADALAELVSLSLTTNGPQWVLAALTIVGIVACIRRRLWWPLIPAAYMACAFVVACVSPEGLLTIVAGLWYSLPYRVGSCLCIFLMPIASLGLATIAQGVASLAESPLKETPLGKNPAYASAATVALAAIVLLPAQPLVIGDVEIDPPLSTSATQLNAIYAQDPHRVYSPEEVAFVNEAMARIPEGALVLNQPHDGSLFAYGVNGINTYFRATGIDGQRSTARIIREGLYRYAHDPEVQQAVEETGAEYLLLLDMGVPYEQQAHLSQYPVADADWEGVDAVNDSIPGFTRVLAEKDMRLYRIGGREGLGHTEDAGHADGHRLPDELREHAERPMIDE